MDTNQPHSSIELLCRRFGAQHFQTGQHVGMDAVIVPKSILAEVMRFLHDDEHCCYEQLTDLIGIDYLGYPQRETRFGLVYLLLSVRHNRRLAVKVLLEEPDLSVPTLTNIYSGANWPEREAAEMFGFSFVDHPDPRRLLLSDLFEGVHPLRKDYPLTGRGERNGFKVVGRDTA